MNFSSLFLIRWLSKDNNIWSISQRCINKPQTCFSAAHGPNSSFVRRRHSAALSRGLVYKGKASDPEGPDSSVCLSSQDILDFVPGWGGRAEWKQLGSFIYKPQVKPKAETLACSKVQCREGGLALWAMEKRLLSASMEHSQSGRPAHQQLCPHRPDAAFASEL